MRSRSTPMSWEEYELLPMHPGWKIEYWNRRAHFSPRHYFAVTRLELKARPEASPVPLAPITVDAQAALTECYFESFKDAYDYCDWEPDQVAESARKCVQEFLSGKRGEPLPASRIAVEESSATQPGRILGAAMIKRSEDGLPMLDFLFVRREQRRRGLATALVAGAINRLLQAGESVLQSCYRLGNEESAAWHRRFGFIEEPDLRITQLYLTCAHHELWRHEKMGTLSCDERKRLNAECERLRHRVNELQAIEEQHGFEAVSPMYRHG
jgi:GNAT superfamily N-acetyltransferase